MSQCGLTSQGLCAGVSRFWGSCAASDVQCPTPCSRRWSSRWSYHASTTALRSNFVDFSQFSMLQPGWYTGHLVTSTFHLGTPTPPLAAVSGAHRFQVSRACLSMFTRSRSSLAIWLLPTCCLFQPSTTSFFVIFAATDSTNTTHNCRRPSFSSRRKPPLGRSSTRRYVSSDSCCFPKAAQNLSFLSFVHVVTDAPRTDTPLSGLAVFDYRPKNNF